MRISKPRRHDNTTASVLSITNAKPRWHDCTNNIVIYYPHIVGKCAARTFFPTRVHGIHISVKAITCLVVRPLLFAIINSQCLHGKFQPAIRRYSLTKDDCTDKYVHLFFSFTIYHKVRQKHETNTHLKFNIGRRRLKFLVVCACLDNIQCSRERARWLAKLKDKPITHYPDDKWQGRQIKCRNMSTMELPVILLPWEDEEWQALGKCHNINVTSRRRIMWAPT